MAVAALRMAVFGAGTLVPGIAVLGIASALLLFGERIGAASVPIMSAGAMAAVMLLIIMAYSAGRIRRMVAGDGMPLVARIPPLASAAVFGGAVPAASVLLYVAAGQGWVQLQTSGLTGTIFTLVFSFACLWLLLGISDKYHKAPANGF
ncbi:MAG: hypothetical protein MPI95_02805 [Nitrosopumilus sp.]|nr:hypothetical protein [Nitrosopumilus sp.]CAI9831704.1 membrane hypothetical protein [Nitrosopumilaceae archaeon]MDA7941009.1 hypothetical protein [Nitrosopumilus sp.]MDA7942593.1 hypothetical protein [Nitrosopumilus sp.]MDA7944441.1 hypothetical protein [Nitrosopumilus sp.]